MSRFYLVEFRYPHHKKWHPWKRTSSKREAKQEIADEKEHEAIDSALSKVYWRYVLIDTDLKRIY